MPKKRRTVEIDRGLLRRYLELVRRSRETDRLIAEDLAYIRGYLRRLREAYGR